MSNDIVQKAQKGREGADTLITKFDKDLSETLKSKDATFRRLLDYQCSLRGIECPINETDK